MSFRPGRITARIALIAAFAAALVIPVVAFNVRGMDQPETWTLAAAALAVMTSIISAWSSRKVVELQEDAQRPNPYPHFDCTSRYGLALFRVKNLGGAPAHNISLRWIVDLRNSDGEVIGFPKMGTQPGIVMLLPGESVSQILGAAHEFLARHPEADFKGTITFEDPLGHGEARPFMLDARHLRGTPTHDEEALKTHYELQQIPKQLEAIKRAVEKAASKPQS